MKFDNKLDVLKFNREYVISEEDYSNLQSFIRNSFVSLGEVRFEGRYFNKTINFHVGYEYCCFTIYADCLFIRRIEIPSRRRGNGFFTEFMKNLENYLASIGIKKVCFENIQNPRLLSHLLNNGYNKAYFNFPIPETDESFDMPDAYKFLG